MLGNSLDILLLEIHIINPEIGIEPLDLIDDQIGRHELLVRDPLAHQHHLVLFAGEHVRVVAVCFGDFGGFE